MLTAWVDAHLGNPQVSLSGLAFDFVLTTGDLPPALTGADLSALFDFQTRVRELRAREVGKLGPGAGLDLPPVIRQLLAEPDGCERILGWSEVLPGGGQFAWHPGAAGLTPPEARAIDLSIHGWTAVRIAEVMDRRRFRYAEWRPQSVQAVCSYLDRGYAKLRAYFELGGVYGPAAEVA